MSQTDTNRPLASSYVASEQQSVAGTTTHAAGTAKPLSEFATDTFMRSSGTFSPTRTSGVHTRTSGVHTSTAAVPTTTYTTAGYTSTIPTSYTAEYTSTAVPTSYTAAEYTSTAVPTTYTTTYANVPGLTGLTGSGTYATYGTTTTEELLKRSGASGYGATGAHHGLATSGYGGTGTHGGLATSGSYSYTHQTHGTIPAGSYTQGVPGGTYTTSAYTTPSHHHDLHQVTSQSIYKPSGSFEVHAVPITSSSQIQSEAIKRTTITTRTSDSPSKRRELKQSLLLAPYRSTMYPEFENVEELPDRRNLVDSINFLLIRSAGKEALLSSPNKVSIKRQSVLSPAEIEFENIFREKYEDGTVYEGGAKHGTKHGKGKLTYKDGRVFEGEFQLGRAVGTGILRYKTGKVCYEGGFNDTVFEGQGVLQSETPIPLKGGFNFRNLNNVENHWIKYEGEFRNGKKHGRGTLHLTNGEKFVGDWRDDQISGRGQYHVLDGQVIEGQWDNGVWRE